MAATMTRADSLREYLSGAASDGGTQSLPALSLGGRRSSTEVRSLGIMVTSAIGNVAVDFASGANAIGPGDLVAIDANSLVWRPYGAANYGPPAVVNGTLQEVVVEANGLPGQYLRVTATSPFTPAASTITLDYIDNAFYGMPDVSISDVSSGIHHYRASVAKNVGSSQLTSLVRSIVPLADQVTCVSGLGSSGAGTVTASDFDGWPASGWCQVRSAAGTLKEVMYYSSRTGTALTVPATGRSLLGTSATAGTAGDLLYAVPGVAVGLDPAGVQASGSSFQTVASATTAPVGVTWSLGITPGTGLVIGALQPGQQAAVWLWRHVPAGMQATPRMVTKVADTFNAF